MDKILVITGGTSGLGLELVKAAIEKGYYVVNLARNREKMAALDEQFKENYKGFVGDISDESFVKTSIESVAKMGSIFGLINCAAKASFKPAAEYGAEDFDVSFESVKGMILCTTAVLKATNESNVKIVNIMSSAALKGNKNEAIYCAAKWGERGYTESLKAEYKGTSVKVMGVYSGGMNTGFWNNSRDYVSEEKANSFMDPKDVAKVVIENIGFDNLEVADIVIERR